MIGPEDSGSDGMSSYTEAFLQADLVGGKISYDGNGGFNVG